MKQTALQQLIAWGDEKLKTEPMKHLSFAEVLDKAETLLKVEREQIINAIDSQYNYDSWLKELPTLGEQYYNETYK